jgi:hypothetical protein
MSKRTSDSTDDIAALRERVAALEVQMRAGLALSAPLLIAVLLWFINRVLDCIGK